MRLGREFPGRTRLLLGLYLLIWTVLVAYEALQLPSEVSHSVLSSSWIGLGTVALALGLFIIDTESLERRRVWIVLLATGCLASLVSGFYVVVNPAPLIPCRAVYDRSGFPLPWRYPAHPDYRLGPECFQLFYYPPLIDWPFLALDVLFYTCAFFAVLELIRATTLPKKMLRV